jgi:glutamate--cysteine ligase
MSVIEKEEELEAFFHDAGKTSDRWRVGTEYEKVGVLKENGVAAPFSGKRGIESVLASLAERFGWEPKNRTVTSSRWPRSNAQITLEPGGQTELSGEPLR